ncbi:MAG: efflux transporter periplasmic adaptor subunit, partial [Parafilimonas terrae]|nr:efflux transporter periplasmic adaptor subunit [Parafilimonas terrae]
MNESSPIRTDTARAYEPGPGSSPVRTRRRFRPIRWLLLLVALAAVGAVAHRWYDAR